MGALGGLPSPCCESDDEATRTDRLALRTLFEVMAPCQIEKENRDQDLQKRKLETSSINGMNRTSLLGGTKGIIKDQAFSREHLERRSENEEEDPMSQNASKEDTQRLDHLPLHSMLLLREREPERQREREHDGSLKTKCPKERPI